MSFTEEDRIKGGQNRKTHGIHAIQNRGEAALDEVAAMGYRQLRDALRMPDAREEIKLELMARLVIMARVGFDQMGVVAEQGGDPFGAPVVGRLGTYLNLLARLLGSFPAAKKDSLADEVERIRALVNDAERAKETVVGVDLDSHSDPPGAIGAAQENESD